MPTTYAIPDGRTVMAATTYTGTGATQVISNAVNGVSFQPDFVWMKKRSAAESHILQNSITGTTKFLISNSTAVEDTSSSIIQSFDTGGFTAGVSSTINGASTTYVAWQWNAGGSTVTNTNGSITSSVRANATAGFSVVTYTGNGLTNQSIGHGLGATPGMVIIKQRSGTANWLVHHQSQPTGYTVYLNLTNAQDSGTSQWGTSPQTSTVFYVGYTAGATGSNVSASTYVAYCWAPVAGYSAFGSFTGNGSADGPFVYLGFRPRFIMLKNASSSPTNWFVWDTSRDPFNVMYIRLFPNTSDADYTNANALDSVSNGFKMRDSSAAWNGSGNTIIYACFAENPFKYANAR